MMDFQYGSLWRKWDLHVHTPMSILCNNFVFNDEEKKEILTSFKEDKLTQNNQVITEDKQESIEGKVDNKEFKLADKVLEMYCYIKQLFNKAIQNEIVAIGITDYFFIDGYKFIKTTLKDKHKMKLIFKKEISVDPDYLDKINKILLVPNVEFRTEVVSGQSKLQVHVIFSDELDEDIIETNFINVLKIVAGSNELPLTRKNVETFGKQCRERGIGGNGNDIEVGTNSISVKIEDLYEISSKDDFKNKTILVLAEEDQSKMSWNSQSGGIRHKYYVMSDAIFTSNNKTMNWCKSKDCKETIGKYLPYLWGSDAHSFDKMFSFVNDKFCWLKSDVTFNGLLYALYRFNNRIFVGKEPEELTELKKREYYTIKELEIKPKKESLQTIWFNSKIYFNPYMTTVIGNKGSGKSAIADILGFLCNSHKMENASFLNNQRFLDKKTRYGDDYRLKLEFFEVGRSIEKEVISSTYDQARNEEIKFLPQSYIEEVCNNIDDRFQDEINNTIFSYVPVHDRTGSSNINELILKKTASINDEIDRLQLDLRDLNKEVILLENKSTSKYNNEIKNKLQALEQKLEIHKNIKPTEVLKPKDIENSEDSNLIILLKEKITEIKNEISLKTEELTQINIKLQLISDYKNKISVLKNEVIKMNEEYKSLSQKLELPSKRFLELKIYKEDIEELEKDLIQKRNGILNLITLNDDITIKSENVNNIEGETVENSISQITNLQLRIKIIEEKISSVSEKISIEQQKYFEYQKAFEEWDKYRKMLEGEIENTIDGESISKLKKEIIYLNENLLKEINEKRRLRREKIKEIINRYFEKRKVLKEIYSPVQEKIESMEGLKNSNIVFKSYMKVDKKNLIDEIIRFIDLRKNSDFKDAHFLEDIIESTDFENEESILNFVDKIYTSSYSNIDNIDSLIKKRDGFNDFVGGMGYLQPNFTINADGKTLSELSPGGRGIVLLIFYLTLSKQNIPLVIDQPEDNLDNQSVFSKLVPAIVEAKKNRQIIVVTHNPNIAIACDSEAVVYCEQNKEKKTLEYITGSIENKIMNEHIVDVLEGTIPAFNIRKETYTVSKE